MTTPAKLAESQSFDYSQIPSNQQLTYNTMINVALITYIISPYRGSEASVSWNFVSKMSEHVKLTVFYGNGNEDITDFLKTQSIPNTTWVHIPVLPTTHGGIRGDLEYNLRYRKWHRDVKKAVTKLVETGDIDIIHYLNPIGFKEPGYCWQFKNIPYIWGPIQGVENRPLSLLRAFSTSEKAKVLLRRVIHNSMFRFMPRVRKAVKQADHIFAATPNTVLNLKKVYNASSTYLPENGILEMERLTPISLDEGQTLRIVFVGAIVSRKGMCITLDALRKVNSRQWHFDIVGDGPLKQSLQAEYSDLADNLTWHGRVSRADAQIIIQQAHLHAITSLGEGNPTVIWEAMSKAIPTLTLDHCGMSAVVCSKCGIKIPIRSYNDVTDTIASEIDNILNRPSTIENLSAGVIECSKQFMWDNRIRLFLDTYSRLLQEYDSKRD